MNIGISVVSVALCLISITFFLIGAIGYSTDYDTIRHIPWIVVSTDGTDQDLYYGLKSISTRFSGIKFYLSYDDDTCTPDWCDDCEKDGDGAFALTFIALFFATVTLVVNFLSATIQGAIALNTVNIVALCSSLLAGIAAVIALGLFMGDCYNEVDDSADNIDLEWGNGAIVVMVGMLVMWIVTILQVCAMFITSCSRS